MEQPVDDDPFPDASAMKIIRVAHDGWDGKSEKLPKISMLALAGIRNARPSVRWMI